MIRVGALCALERTYSHAPTKVQEAWTSKIVKVTKARAYFAGGTWFALKDDRRIVQPAYLNYVTRVVDVDMLPKPAADNMSDTKGEP